MGGGGGGWGTRGGCNYLHFFIMDDRSPKTVGDGGGRGSLRHP